MTQETIDQYVRSALALAGYALREPATAEVRSNSRASTTSPRPSSTRPCRWNWSRPRCSVREQRRLGLARQIRDGERSASAVLEATLARIREADPRYHCFTSVTETRARQEAAAIDAARAEASPAAAGRRALCGQEPVRYRRRGHAGRRPRQRRQPARAARCVLAARLREAGAVLVGALNMDEHAYGFTTENSHYGACRNPHDPPASPAARRRQRRGGSRRPGAADAGLRHQRLDPRACLAVRRVRPEADLRPPAAHRLVPLCRQP